jgi:hypothetical protein
MTSQAVQTTDATAAAISAAFGSGSLAPQDQGQQAPQGDTDYGQVDVAQGYGQPPENVSAPQQPVQGDGQNQQMVPSFRLREVTERARAAEAQSRQAEAQINELQGMVRGLMATVQQGQQAPQQQVQQTNNVRPLPDMLNDPEGYAVAVQREAAEAANHQMRLGLEENARTMNAMKLQVSDLIAASVHGRDMIRDATHAAKAAGLMPQMMQQSDPVGAAINWYKGQVSAQRYGTDPNQIKQNVLAEILNDPRALQQIVAAATGRPLAPAAPQRVLPPALSSSSRGQTFVPPTDTPTALSQHFADRAARMSGSGQARVN